ncbi:MAG: HlyD family type I secretion periplasmic adaptor subunit [Thermoguttaceae bacterium]
MYPPPVLTASADQNKNPHTAILDEDRQFMGEVDLAWNDQGSVVHKTVTITLCGLFAAFLIWAQFAEIDEVTRGNGQVIPSSRTQVISHLEGGILGEVYVHEGLQVEKGQLLARVENVGATSVVRDVQNKIWEHKLAIICLEAELAEKEPVFPDDLPKDMEHVRAQQLQAHDSRQRKLASDIQVQDSQVKQRESELVELKGRETTLDQALTLATRREALAAPMVEKGLYAEVDFISLQQEVVRLSGELTSVKENIGKAEKMLEEAKLKQVAFIDSHRSELVSGPDGLNKHRSELASLEESLATGKDRLGRTDLISPMAGVVNKILLNTKGSAVRPSEPIMEIVPSDDTLLIEAKIKPSDIGFIYPKQKAIVKLTAYDFNIFGGLEAYVEQIAADTTEGRNQDYYYLVKLRTNETGLDYRGKKLPIIPGMVASVDIITGKKTVMQYLLKPIMKAKENAFRER